MTETKPVISKPEPNAEEKQFLEHLDREVLNTAVLNEFALYSNTGDGRFLWRAILVLQRAGEPIPNNLQTKLAQWASKLLTAESQGEICAALELIGDGKKHLGPKHGIAYRKRWRLAGEVRIVMDLYKISSTKAIASVAKNRGLSIEKVKKDYHAVFGAANRQRNGQTPTDLDQVLRSWTR